MKQFLLLFAASSLLAGCSTSMRNGAATLGFGDRVTVAALLNETSGLSNDPEVINLLKVEGKESKDVKAASGATKDLIVGALLARSDRYCNEFLSSVGSTQRQVNTATLIADSAFSTAAVVALSQATTKRMTGFAGGARGLRGNLNQGLFEGQQSSLIMLAVLKLRSERKDVLIKNLKSGGDLSDVNIGLVLPYIEEYHSTCTLAHGLAELQKNLATPNPQPVPPPSPPSPPTPPQANPQS